MASKTEKRYKISRNQLEQKSELDWPNGFCARNACNERCLSKAKPKRIRKVRLPQLNFIGKLTATFKKIGFKKRYLKEGLKKDIFQMFHVIDLGRGKKRSSKCLTEYLR